MLTIGNHASSFFCRCLVITLCISLATGCMTTLKPVPLTDSQSVQSQISPGDEVRLTTKDGKVREFKVKEVTALQLIVESENGESENVNLSDIDSIERRELSPESKAGIAGLVVSGVAFIFLYVLPLVVAGVVMSAMK